MVNEIKQRFNIVEDFLDIPAVYIQDQRRESYSGVNPALRPSEADTNVPLLITSNGTWCGVVLLCVAQWFLFVFLVLFCSAGKLV
jgi:hypothetical protein